MIPHSSKSIYKKYANQIYAINMQICKSIYKKNIQQTEQLQYEGWIGALHIYIYKNSIKTFEYKIVIEKEEKTGSEKITKVSLIFL